MRIINIILELTIAKKQTSQYSQAVHSEHSVVIVDILEPLAFLL